MIVKVTGSVLPFINHQRGRHQFFTSGTVRFMLVLPTRNEHVAKNKLTGRTLNVHIDVPVHFDGTFEAHLESNNEIMPAGTSYAMLIMIPNVNIVPAHYTFDGPGPFNINAMTPMEAGESKRRHAENLRSQIAELQRQLKDVEG